MSIVVFVAGSKVGAIHPASSRVYFPEEGQSDGTRWVGGGLHWQDERGRVFYECYNSKEAFVEEWYLR